MTTAPHRHMYYAERSFTAPTNPLANTTGTSFHNDSSFGSQNSRYTRKKPVTFGPYYVGSTLGEGEFGKVKLGWSKANGDSSNMVVSKQVAIKLIRREAIMKGSDKELKIYREINALKHLTHPNIVKLEEVLQNSKYIGIVLEYASGGEFYKYIQRKRRLKEPLACRLFAQLISGVYYMHCKGLVHRDLKLENLLLDKHGNLIITDFGFVNEFSKYNELMKTSCGSPCYAAPELVVSTRPYEARKADIWSCGIILFAMLAGYLPWDDDPQNPDGNDIAKLYQYIVSTSLKFPEYISPVARDLLRYMLVSNPAKRAALKVILKHEWLATHDTFLSITPEDWDQKAKLGIAATNAISPNSSNRNSMVFTNKPSTKINRYSDIYSSSPVSGDKQIRNIQPPKHPQSSDNNNIHNNKRSSYINTSSNLHSVQYSNNSNIPGMNNYTSDSVPNKRGTLIIDSSILASLGPQPDYLANKSSGNNTVDLSEYQDFNRTKENSYEGNNNVKPKLQHEHASTASVPTFATHIYAELNKKPNRMSYSEYSSIKRPKSYVMQEQGYSRTPSSDEMEIDNATMRDKRLSSQFMPNSQMSKTSSTLPHPKTKPRATSYHPTYVPSRLSADELMKTKPQGEKNALEQFQPQPIREHPFSMLTNNNSNHHNSNSYFRAPSTSHRQSSNGRLASNGSSTKIHEDYSITKNSIFDSNSSLTPNYSSISDAENMTPSSERVLNNPRMKRKQSPSVTSSNDYESTYETPISSPVSTDKHYIKHLNKTSNNSGLSTPKHIIVADQNTTLEDMDESLEIDIAELKKPMEGLFISNTTRRNSAHNVTPTRSLTGPRQKMSQIKNRKRYSLIALPSPVTDSRTSLISEDSSKISLQQHQNSTTSFGVSDFSSRNSSATSFNSQHHSHAVLSKNTTLVETPTNPTKRHQSPPSHKPKRPDEPQRPQRRPSTHYYKNSYGENTTVGHHKHRQSYQPPPTQTLIKEETMKASHHKYRQSYHPQPPPPIGEEGNHKPRRTLSRISTPLSIRTSSTTKSTATPSSSHTTLKAPTSTESSPTPKINFKTRNTSKASQVSNDAKPQRKGSRLLGFFKKRTVR